MDFCSFDPNGSWKTVNYYCLFNNISGSWISGKWYVNYLKKHATIIWSNLNEYGGIDTDGGFISVTPSEETSFSSSYFDPDNVIFYNTSIANDAYGFNDIVLDFPSRLVSIVLDESGSMSWRDGSNFRHTLARSYVEKLSNTYPNEVKYKIFKFGGKTVHINLSSDLTSNNPYDSTQKFFQQYLFRDSVNNFNGIRIVRRSDGYPANPIDGEIIFDGISSNFHDTDLLADQTYYYTIYTFDSDYKFSNGVNISVKPTEDTLPRGVKTIQTEVLSGSGVSIDDNVKGVWHMDEGSKEVLYDFNANVDLSISDSNPIWLNKRDVPTGSSGLRFNGDTTFASTLFSTSRLSINSGGQMTIMAWIYPFDLGNQTSIVSRASSDGLDVNYIFGVDGVNNRLSLQKGTGVGDTVYSNAGALIDNEWNHVACVVDLGALSVLFYVNGVPFGSSVLVDGTTGSGDMVIDIGTSPVPAYSKFFGYMTEVSVHDTVRDFSYITNNNNTFKDDNGDRLIVFKYMIPQEYGFLNTNVHIIKNNFKVPSSIYDGDPIYSKNISYDGGYYTTYREDFLLGSTYYFRSFSEDISGNITDINDSMSFSVEIPYVLGDDAEEIEDESLSLPYPENVVTYAGDRKIHLVWSLTVDERISRVRIYRSSLAFPIIDDLCHSNAELVYECDPLAVFSYTDRNLPNDIRYFYTIVAIDRYERSSLAINVSGKPQSGLDESSIPLMEVKNISYSIDSSTGVNITWDDVIQIKDLSTYLPNSISFYMEFTDDYGNVLQEDYLVSAEISASYSYPKSVSEDIFSETLPDEGDINSPAIEDLYSYSITDMKNGTVKGEIIPSSDVSLFDSIEKLELIVRFVISMSVAGNEILTYKSLPLYMEWKNPLSFEIANRDNRYVVVTSKKKISALDNQIPSTDITYDGTYVGASKPYSSRIYLWDRGMIASQYSSVSIQIWDAYIDWSDAGSSPSRVQPSTIIANLDQQTIQYGLRDVLDDYGVPTGDQELVSYVDVRFSKPEQSMGVFIYVKTTLLSGYSTTKRSFVVFGNPLKIEIIPRVPVSDGREVAEQCAVVYMVDPDNPSDLSLRTYPPDSTLVSWKLEPGDYAIERIFYSTDSVSRTDGIYSLLNGGVAKKIIFGPLNNIKIQAYDEDGNPKYEIHKLIASVFYNGITATDSIDLELIPLRERGHRVMPSNFLMEFSELKQTFWSDGIGYATLVVSHDAQTSVTKYSEAFRECMASRGKTIYKLSHGQMVRIDTNDTDVEIIWGDVKEIFDPYLDRWELDTTNANIAYGAASVNLSELDDTYIYFRLNRLYSDQKPIGFESLKTECSMAGINKETRYQNEIVVTGHIVSEFDGKIITLAGGGSMETGILPTILVPRESLDIEIADRRAKDKYSNIVRSSGVVIDGSTINQFVLDISFAEGNVPDGTKVSVSVVNYTEESVKVINTDLTTVTYTDPEIDPAREHSYVTLELAALQPRKDLVANISVTVSYDELGKLERTKTICLLVRHDANDWSDESSIAGMRSIFGSRTDSYDIALHKWSSLSDMSEARGHLCVEQVSNILYAIGGINSIKISNTVESYDISSNMWELKAPMSYPRMAASSVAVGNKIYVFGGIDYNTDTNKMSVIRKSEVYDTTTDTWTDIEDMPLIDIGAINEISYGVAYGKAIYVAALDRIYVVSGIKDITGNGTFVDYNDRILYYDILLDAWGYSDMVVFDDFMQYFRISPVAFLDADNIIVLSGAYQNTDQSLDYLVTSYLYNVNTGSLSSIDGYFDHILQPRYLSGSCHFGDRIYTIGGSGEKSETLSNFEEIFVSGLSPTYNVSELVTALKSRNGCGIAVVNYGGNDFLLVAGGIESGKGTGFLNINISSTEDVMQLNGIQNFDSVINVVDDAGNTKIDAEVTVNAYIQKIGVKDDSIIQSSYLTQNILLYEDVINILDGEAVVSLMPRADDLISDIVSKFEQTGTEITDRYKIVLQGTITNGFVDQNVSTMTKPYYGRTPIGIIKTGDSPATISPDCVISLVSNTTIEALNNSIYGDNKFKVLSPPLYQSPSYSIICGSDIMSIPTITDLTEDGEVSMSGAMLAIDEIEATNSDGPSPLYDCLYDLSIAISDEKYDGYKKHILLLADHDQNASENTLSEAIGSINDIQSRGIVPVLAGDLSIYSNRSLLPYSVERDGDFSFDKLSYDTGGQSFSLTSDAENFANEILCTITGKLKGSPGYGTAEYVLDLGEIISLKSANVQFDIPDNSTGSWRVAVSDNGYEYTPYTIFTNYDNSVQFEKLRTRYIKFFFRITSCLSDSNAVVSWSELTIDEWSELTIWGWSLLEISDAFVPAEDYPKVIGFYLSYVPVKYDYIYTNDVDFEVDLQQVVATVDANSENGIINVGVSRSSSHNWDDYNKDGSPSRVHSGKIITPMRGSYQTVPYVLVYPVSGSTIDFGDIEI